MLPALSVIIPSRDNKREKNFSLHHTLRAIYAQIGVDIEVVVVDDCGTDDTISTVLTNFDKVRVVRSDDALSNVGRLRNLGAATATGDVLVFVDDDTILCQHSSLRRLQELATNFDFGCGAHRLWTSVYWYRFLQAQQSASSMLQTVSDIAILPKGINRENGFRDLNEFSFIGNFGFIRRKTFEAVGGFDEHFPGWGFEDVDLMMRLCLAPTTHVLLRDFGLKVIHLTHSANIRSDYLRNAERFSQLEQARGYYFHANHFFGVYEADGYSLLTPV
jgi:glycosyltransferase involved in cell wall biosynthesis